MQKQPLAILCALFGITSHFVSQNAHADWNFLPESRHHLFQSYSFFIEQHNMVDFRGSGRFWAAVAINLPVAGNDDSPYHPQFLFHLSGNDSMFLNEGGGVFTETLDTRIGFMVEGNLPWWELKLSLGFFHESGHVADGTTEPALIPLNLGDNVYRIRILRDLNRLLRAGITLDPISHAIPDNLVMGINEFAEVFPFESKEDPHAGSPFLAMGIGHRATFTGSINFHAQAGVAFGSHFQEKHMHDFRVVVGYYSGGDPRAKYAQFEGLRSEFGYFGAMFNL